MVGVVYPPVQDWMGSSIASTCYPAGGMPLAFRKRTFLFIGCICLFDCSQLRVILFTVHGLLYVSVWQRIQGVPAALHHVWTQENHHGHILEPQGHRPAGERQCWQPGKGTLTPSKSASESEKDQRTIKKIKEWATNISFSLSLDVNGSSSRMYTTPFTTHNFLVENGKLSH